MKQLQKWTVCLNMEALDVTVMQQIAGMAKFFQPESLHLLHVMEGPVLPDILHKDYPDLHQPDQEALYNKMYDLSRQYLQDITNVDIEVREGNKLKEILSALMERETDLVVVGRGKRGGSVMKKIVRKSSASVLMVPEKIQVPLQHILVATDFSAHSTRAIQIASNLATALEIPRTTVAHISADPSKYALESVETAYDVENVLKKRLVVEEKLRTYSKHKLSEQLAEASPSGEVHELILPTTPGGKKSEALVEWVKEGDADFVVLGAKGQSLAQTFFLGSFAEDVYSRLSRQVVLLYKQKGENAGFLRMLLGKSN